jgi:hypothetical protein
MKQFKPKRINKNTELFNAGVYLTNNIPRGKRAYISTPSDVKNNGTLRRVYNKNGLNEALRIRGGGPDFMETIFQQTTLDSSTIKTLIYNASVCVFSTHP